MAGKRIDVSKLNFKVPTQDERFGVDGAGTVLNIEVELLVPFEGHPFKVKDDEEMNDLVTSIEKYGIRNALIIRESKQGRGKYEVISGHRRLHAAKILGLEKVPCVKKNMNDDEAIIAMVEENLLSREIILPSEKAFSYKMKMDALKRQGSRTDLTSDHDDRKLENDENSTSNHDDRKLETAEKIGKETGDSQAQVRRYIRLTYLIPELLQMVDDGKIGLVPGSEISFLDTEVQTWLYEYIRDNGKITGQKITELKHLAAKSPLTKEILLLFLQGEKKPKKKKVSFSERKLHKYFPKTYSQKQMEDVMTGLLEKWKEEHEEEFH